MAISTDKAKNPIEFLIKGLNECNRYLLKDDFN